MDRVLTWLRPSQVVQRVCLGIARLSPRPTSLILLVALCVGGWILLVSYFVVTCSWSIFGLISPSGLVLSCL